MHYVEILYEEKDHDDVFTFLKNEFGSNTGDVEVLEHIQGELVRIQWEKEVDPIELCTKMTEELSSVIIETESNNGMESTARFFNGAQLW